MICQDEQTNDWLAAKLHNLVAWEVSRLNMLSLDALRLTKDCSPCFWTPWRIRSDISCGSVG
jgi:hypothetical protein